jgi:chemotaxis protein methyltransferase CheR
MPEVPVARSVAGGFSPQTFDGLAAWVRRQLGIVFSPEQREQFGDRLRTFVNSKELTPESLLASLERGDPTLTRQMAEVVSTNYTFFMRESESFDFMRQNIFPLLPREQVRIWSAAASSGDEAYTTAMHCYEKFGGETPKRVRILGTDISQRQIEQAEAGVIPWTSFRWSTHSGGRVGSSLPSSRARCVWCASCASSARSAA